MWQLSAQIFRTTVGENCNNDNRSLSATVMIPIAFISRTRFFETDSRLLPLPFFYQNDGQGLNLLMTTRIKHLRAETHSLIGDIIQRDVDLLIERWAARAKEEQPNAARVHHAALVDHLPNFLAKLGRSLSSASDQSDLLQREAEEHGDQRWDNGWSVAEVVRDYQILRVVMTEFLEQSLNGGLGPRESLVLNVAIDDAIAASVSAFVASQTNPGTAANTTRGEAIDLLLNVLGTVGHEIRNPLAPLMNSLEILRLAGSDTAKVEQIRQMMERQLRVLSRLVDDIMDLPRLARGKMSLRREEVDVAGLVRACAEDRFANLKKAGLTLTLELAARTNMGVRRRYATDTGVWQFDWQRPKVHRSRRFNNHSSKRIRSRASAHHGAGYRHWN